MKILLTAPITEANKRYFPNRLLDRLSALGELYLNETGRRMTREELMPLLSDVDAVLTHWGSIQYDQEMLEYAPRLKIIGHCAGTVAHIASEEAYKKGITVLSANSIMCKYVAEWTLGAMINGLRRFQKYDRVVRRGEWHGSGDVTSSIFDTEIGIVGLGSVGRVLLDLLAPFGCRVFIFDPYITDKALEKWDNAQLSSFEKVMQCQIVSIHASQTPETYHMINSQALEMIPNEGLLINSARASLIDTEALISELQSGRIYAAIDVFDHERHPQDTRLLSCLDNSLLQPHMAATPATACMTEAIVEDLERYSRGEPMKMQVSIEKYRLMTQE